MGLLRYLPILATAIVTSSVYASDYTTTSSPTSSANAASNHSVISKDGLKIVWWTAATNLVSGSGNSTIVMYQPATGTYTNLSSGLSNVSRPSISRDGKYVAYYGSTTATSSAQPYVVEVATLTRVGPTVTSTLLGPSDATEAPSISDDNATHTPTLAYRELANRSSGKFIIPFQIMEWTVGGGAPVVVSKTSGGEANASCSTPLINQDATAIAFVTTATNLQSGTGGFSQVLLSTGSGTTWATTEVVSTGFGGGGPSAYNCIHPTMNGDGTILAFERQTAAKVIDVWVRKRSLGTTFIPYDTSIGSFSAQMMTTDPSLSASGNTIAFVSFRTLGGITLTQAQDAYPYPYANPPIPVVGYLGSVVFVMKVDVMTSPVYVSYHDDGTIKHTRGGYSPALSEYGSELVFDTNQDRVVGGSIPPFNWIVFRTGAVW